MKYDYKFEIGDKVITTDGQTGKIVNICTCDECKRRGFYEPIWVADDDHHLHPERYISIICAENGFPGFYQIGKYRFHNFDKAGVLKEMADCEEELCRLRKQLEVIEQYE